MVQDNVLHYLIKHNINYLFIFARCIDAFNRVSTENWDPSVFAYELPKL